MLAKSRAMPAESPASPTTPAPTDIVPRPSPPRVAEVPPLPPPVIPEAKPATAAEKKTTIPPADLGKGGEQHKAMQQRIKEAAEALGFRSVIEKQISDGRESVDLMLERGDQKFACEISVSTTIDHEVGNVR